MNIKEKSVGIETSAINFTRNIIDHYYLRINADACKNSNWPATVCEKRKASFNSIILPDK